jgi:hypothetical protein
VIVAQRSSPPNPYVDTNVTSQSPSSAFRSKSTFGSLSPPTSTSVTAPKISFSRSVAMGAGSPAIREQITRTHRGREQWSEHRLAAVLHELERLATHRAEARWAFDDQLFGFEEPQGDPRTYFRWIHVAAMTGRTWGVPG